MMRELIKMEQQHLEQQQLLRQRSTESLPRHGPMPGPEQSLRGGTTGGAPYSIFVLFPFCGNSAS